jgi:hypothetical protein
MYSNADRDRVTLENRAAMIECYRPKSEPKAINPRPPGAISRTTELAIRQALVTSKPVHMELLDWAQTGIMRRRIPEISRMDAAGEPMSMYEETVLSPKQRIRIAKSAAPFFTSRSKRN